jgi:hypothetical protein
MAHTRTRGNVQQIIGRRAVFATIALLLGTGWSFAQVPPPPPVRFVEYSAKFLCGEAKEQGAVVRPGTYETSINIHNPAFQPVIFAKKAVRAPREGDEQFRRPEFRLGRLEADFAEQVDCKVIRSLLGSPVGNDPFVEGFVVLIVIPIPWDTSHELDVVGVYTVDTPQRSISLEVVPIASRFLPIAGAEGHRLRDQLLQSKPE